MRTYRLYVSLPYIAPAIWRRLEVSGAMSFAALHEVLQTAMGWENYHLWTFDVDKTEIGPPVADDFAMLGEPELLPAARTTLDAALGGRRIKFRYTYDLGDDWLHEIKVEKVSDPDPSVQYPRCTGGARACPPEDCGGYPGYHDLLEAIGDPKHPEHAGLLEWVGEDFDPEAFDLEAVNRRLQARKRKSRAPAKK